MKKVLVAFFVFVTLTVTQAFAYNLKSFSSDSTIIAAMQLLEANGEYDVFQNLRKNAVKIKFQTVLYKSYCLQFYLQYNYYHPLQMLHANQQDYLIF